MGADVIPVDLELFLTTWYRAALAARPEPYCQGVQTDRVEPDQGIIPVPFVVIRDDGGTSDLLLTAEHSVGISVLAGTQEDPRPALDLGRMILGLRTRIPSPAPDNPVAAVTGATGPYLVPEDQPYARAYLTVTFRVVGLPL